MSYNATTHSTDARRDETQQDTKHCEMDPTYVKRYQITAFGLVVFPLDWWQAPHCTSPGLRIDLWLMFNARWKPSGSLLDVEHEYHTIKGTICVSCAHFAMRSIYILYTIGLIRIVREQERGLFFLIFFNILMIFQREYNRVLIPTPGWIEQNQRNQSTQNPN